MISTVIVEDAINMVIEDFHVLRGLHAPSPGLHLVKPPADCWVRICTYQAASDHRERWPTVTAHSTTNLRCICSTIYYGECSARDLVDIPWVALILYLVLFIGVGLWFGHGAGCTWSSITSS